MLGTLVALAVSKMVNLETFVWDMPTGVLSDIFMALASLPDNHADNQCKLDRLWIRWHDNSPSSPPPTASATIISQAQQLQVPLGSTLTPIGILLPSNMAHPKPRGAIPYSESQVEYPTFSVVPPLRSLTVLDIDELAYLDEMAVLIGNSKDRLQELRVGMSAKAQHKDFIQIWDGADLQQIDPHACWPGESTIGERRLGGVLGVLVGRVYEIRRKGGARLREKGGLLPVGQTATATSQTPPGGVPDVPQPIQGDAIQTAAGQEPAAEGVALSGEINAAVPPAAVAATTVPASQPQSRMHVEVNNLKASHAVSKSAGRERSESRRRKRLDGKLRLQTLELERVPLSMQVCGKAFDWTTLTSLAILDCAQHENFWRLLRRQFQPTAVGAGFGLSTSSTKAGNNSTSMQYHLNLKRIHTDVTSTPLLAFIKETLAPNSLEVLFLQDRRRGTGPPSVTLNAIFKEALKSTAGASASCSSTALWGATRARGLLWIAPGGGTGC